MASQVITLNVEAQKILRQFSRLPAATQNGVLKGLKTSLILLRERVIAGTDVKWPRGNAGLKGRLTRYAEPSTWHGVEAAIGFRKAKGFPYELAQEFGAKAKPGGAMAIPLTSAARKAGSPRNFPRKLVHFVNTHVLGEPYKRGTQKGGIKSIQYVLVKKIKPRLGFMFTVLHNMNLISDNVEKGANNEFAKV